MRTDRWTEGDAGSNLPKESNGRPSVEKFVESYRKMSLVQLQRIAKFNTEENELRATRYLMEFKLLEILAKVDPTPEREQALKLAKALRDAGIYSTEVSGF